MSLIQTALHADTRADRIKALIDYDWTLTHAIARKRQAVEQMSTIARQIENDYRVAHPGRTPGCYCEYACECALEMHGTRLHKEMSSKLHFYGVMMSRESWKLERKQRFVRRLINELEPQGQEPIPMHTITRSQRRRAA